MRVGVLALNGVTDSGLAVALDVLRAARVLAKREGRRDPFSIHVFTVGGRAVRTASGALTTTGRNARPPRCDVLLVPGCWLESAEHLDGWLAREETARAIELIARAAKRGAWVGGSCTATFLLAEAGLLDDGALATTTWWLEAAFRARFPSLELDVTRSMTTTGRVLCAGSVFAMADLALAVVARLAGPQVARQCMRVLLLDTHPSQAPYMVLEQTLTNEPLVEQAEAWIRARLRDQFSVDELAGALRVTPRTLSRRLLRALGVSPLGLVQRVRVEVASHLLETTSASVDEVAEQVGYRDGGTLRRLLKRASAPAPRRLRRVRRA